MAKKPSPIYAAEQAACYVVYERQEGRILAVHHLVALPGVRIRGEEVVRKQVLTCAAAALGRPARDLRVLSTPQPVTVTPDLSVDVASGKLRRSVPGRAAVADDQTRVRFNKP